MGIRHIFNAERGLVRAVRGGPVTADDITRYWALRGTEVQVHDQRRALVDLSRCQVRFAGDEMHRPMRSLVKPYFSHRAYRIAILTRDLVPYGTARQFQALFNDIGVCVIFDDEAAALEWLEDRAQGWRVWKPLSRSLHPRGIRPRSQEVPHAQGPHQVLAAHCRHTRTVIAPAFLEHSPLHRCRSPIDHSYA